jgi:hypothetical protein
VADLVEVYYLEHVKKINEVDEFFYDLLKYSFEHGEQTRMESLIDRVIEYILSHLMFFI